MEFVQDFVCWYAKVYCDSKILYTILWVSKRISNFIFVSYKFLSLMNYFPFNYVDSESF